jgi:hypothetical protein
MDFAAPQFVVVGGRRLAYRPQLIGLETRRHSGGLDVGADGRARYAPHTDKGYKASANKTLLVLNDGLANTGVGQAARKAEAMSPPSHMPGRTRPSS